MSEMIIMHNVHDNDNDDDDDNNNNKHFALPF